MRERVPTLLYIAAALALCGTSIAAVDSVRASEQRRTHALERARQEAKRAAVAAQQRLDAITRELEAIDAALERAIEALRHATDEEREQRRTELLELQRRQFDLSSAVAAEDCARRRSHCGTD